MKNLLITSVLWMITLHLFGDPVFKNIEPFKWSGNVDTYDKGTLYDYINGGSEFYFNYGFKQLWVTEYSKDSLTFTLEVYQHKTPDYSYGIFSQERPMSAKLEKLGSEGYITGDAINYYIGPFYIKVYGDAVENAKNDVFTFITDYNKQFEGVLIPQYTEWFPKEFLVPNSLKYIANEFMGYSTFGGGFQGEYEKGNKFYNFFIIPKGSSKGAKETMDAYFKYLQLDLPKEKELYKVEDPYNGEILIYLEGQTILGFSGKVGKKEAENIIKDALAKNK